MTDLPPPYPGLNTAPGAYNAPPYPGLNSAPGAYNAPPYPGLNPAPGAYNAPFYDPSKEPNLLYKGLLCGFVK